MESSRLSVLFVWASVTLGCNGLFDIAKPIVADDNSLTEGEGGAGGESGSLDVCTKDEDCHADAPRCLFERCSRVCELDDDCRTGERCLETSPLGGCIVPSSGICEADGDCPRGAVCHEDVCRSECASDDDCLKDQRCRAGACFGTDPLHEPEFEPCEEGTTRCEALTFQLCDEDGFWADTDACDYLCDDRSGCYGECEPGRETCEDSTSRKQCDQQGSWTSPQQCSAVCSNGKCESGCVPEDVQCLGLELSVCRTDGMWGLEETCPYLCDEEDAQCTGMCTPDTKDCDGRELLECDSLGEFQLLTTCPSVCMEDEAAAGQSRCADCLPGAEQCLENITERCQADGTWDAVEDCFDTDRSCTLNNGVASCQGECAPGQVSCDGWDAIQCESGSWSPLQTCSEPDEICRSGACEDNSPYFVGEWEEAGFGSGSVVPGVHYLVPITVSVRAEILDFRVRTFGAPGTVTMALYSDEAGQPADLLLPSASFSGIPVLDEGETTNVTVVFPASEYVLVPGETYYIAALFDSSVASIPRKAGPGWEGLASYPAHPAVFSAFGEENNVYPFFLTVREHP